MRYTSKSRLKEFNYFRDLLLARDMEKEMIKWFDKWIKIRSTAKGEDACVTMYMVKTIRRKELKDFIGNFGIGKPRSLRPKFPIPKTRHIEGR